MNDFDRLMQRLDDSEKSIIGNLATEYRQKEFGEYLFYPQQFSINLLELMSKNLEIEIRFIIFKEKTLCLVGNSKNAPSYKRVREVFDDLGIDELPLLDIHNHPGGSKKNNFDYLNPSIPDISSASPAQASGIITSHGLCLYPSLPYSLYGRSDLWEKFYDIFIDNYSPKDALSPTDEAIKNASGLKRIVLATRKYVDRIALKDQLKKDAVSRFITFLQEQEQFELHVLIVNQYLQKVLVDPLDKFQFNWEELERFNISQITDLNARLWKKIYPHFLNST